MPPGILVFLVVAAALVAGRLGGPVIAVLFAVVGSAVAAILQIRAAGRSKD
jgi:hypothetical protein